MAGPSITNFLDDEALLQPYFEGPSWYLWKAILRGTFGLPLDRAERRRFQSVAGGREPPSRPVRELVAVVGRGGGKDSIATAVATFIACTADFSRLRPGELGTILCLAANRDQARIALNYLKGYFEQTALLAPMLKRVTDDTIELTNRAQIIILPNNYRAPRGLTICCAIYDEVGFWWSEDYANPDIETDTAVSPGLARFAGSLKIMISSANKRSGLLYDRFAEFFGKNDPDVLVVKGTSLEFNPTLDKAIIDRELRRDLERASAEYLSEWRDDLTTFLDRALVEAALDRGVTVRPPQLAFRYTSFCDPSGGRGDSFTAGIAHAEGNLLILDALYERRAPFDPSTVVAEIAALLRSYGITEISGDKYAAQWVVEAFAKEGIRYIQSERDKSQIFLDVLPLFTAGRTRILDSQRLTYQLISLERRSTRVGRDIVSHPDHANSHDDLANSATGALVLAASEHLVPSLWRNSDLYANNRPVRWPARSLICFATASVDFHGTYVCFWSKDANRYAAANGAIILVDYLQAPLGPGLFRQVADRLQELASMPVQHPQGHTIPAATNRGIICVTELRPHCEAAGLDVHATDGSTLLQQRDALLLACGSWIASGAVKVSDIADAKSHALPLPLSEVHSQAPESAALDAVLLGLGSALPAELQPVEWKELAA